MTYEEIFMEGYYDALAESCGKSCSKKKKKACMEEDYDIYDDIENELDFDNEYEDSFLEGYYDALNEIVSNPLPILGGGDLKGDILASFGIGNGPERAAAIKNYFDHGDTITGGLIGGTYGTEGGMLYRKNKILPGATNAEQNDAAYFANIYSRLKPADRKKIMDAYKKRR